MGMRAREKYFQFQLSETKCWEDDFERLLFRFYPERSSVHSFDDEPPKRREDVYKTYYVWKIIRQRKLGKDHGVKSDIVFDPHTDEDSVMGYVSDILEKIYQGIYSEEWTDEDGEKRVSNYLNERITRVGYGAEWEIRMREYEETLDKNGEWMEDEEKWYAKRVFTIILWNFEGIGFRFQIGEKELPAFAKFLKECDDYAFAHGEGI